ALTNADGVRDQHFWNTTLIPPPHIVLQTAPVADGQELPPAWPLGDLQQGLQEVTTVLRPGRRGQALSAGRGALPNHVSRRRQETLLQGLVHNATFGSDGQLADPLRAIGRRVTELSYFQHSHIHLRVPHRHHRFVGTPEVSLDR